VPCDDIELALDLDPPPSWAEGIEVSAFLKPECVPSGSEGIFEFVG